MIHTIQTRIVRYKSKNDTTHDSYRQGPESFHIVRSVLWIVRYFLHWLYLIKPLFEGIGKNSISVVLTVVVVMEFTASSVSC